MRGPFAFITIMTVGGALFLWQKQAERKTAPAELSPEPTPATRQVFQHDWAKKSLDTTHSVIDQIQRQRKDEDLKDAVGRR